MTINLPKDLEQFIRAEVLKGRFRSEDDAIAEAVQLLQHQLNQAPKMTTTVSTCPDPVLGALRDAADDLDEIAAESMMQREQQPWHLSSDE